MVERKVYYQKVNCNNSPFLCFNNSANQFLLTSTHQIGAYANVTDKTIHIMVHQIYAYQKKCLKGYIAYRKSHNHFKSAQFLQYATLPCILNEVVQEVYMF